MHLLADFEFPKVDRTAGGVTSQEGQLVNSRPPEIGIYLRTYTRVLSSHFFSVQPQQECNC